MLSAVQQSLIFVRTSIQRWRAAPLLVLLGEVRHLIVEHLLQLRVAHECANP